MFSKRLMAGSSVSGKFYLSMKKLMLFFSRDILYIITSLEHYIDELNREEKLRDECI